MTLKIGAIKKVGEEKNLGEMDSNVQKTTNSEIFDPVVKNGRRGALALFKDFVLVGGDLV